MTEAAMPIWEVFIRARAGLSHRHVGSVHAADAAMALLAGRRIVRSVPLWRAAAIRAVHPVPSVGLPALRAMRWIGERRRRRFTPRAEPDAALLSGQDPAR